MKRLAWGVALVAALLLTLGAAPATAVTSVADDEASARVWSGDGVIKRCKGHGYRYAVQVPAGDSWSLEVFLVNKRGKTVAFSYLLKGGDPKKGKERLPFCARQVKPGRYKVKARLIWSHYSQEYREWAKPRKIRLRRP